LNFKQENFNENSHFSQNVHAVMGLIDILEKVVIKITYFMGNSKFMRR
jgi:hypothetical protein